MSFSLLLNSHSYYSQANANGDTTYAVNFTNYPEGKYNLTFSYYGEQNHLNGTDLANVYVSFQSAPRMTVLSGSVGNQNSNYIGTLKKELLANGNDGYLYAAPTDNPPVHFPQKPTTNFIQVQLLNRAGTVIVLHDVADPNVAGYMLTLHFEKLCDNCDMD